MLYSWFSRLETVRAAATPAEREHIYRFRYALYVKHKGWEVPGADHDARMIRDELDELPNTVHLYAGEETSLRGTARLRVFTPGTHGDELGRRYATHLFPSPDALSMAELTGFMIQPGLRGRLLLPAMVRAIYDTLATRGVDVLLASCRPGLVADYRKFGLRPYPAPLINEFDGISVPLLCLLSDADYFNRCRAMAADLVPVHFGEGRRAPLKLDPWRPLLQSDEQRLHASDGAAIDAAASRLSESDASVHTVFDALPTSVRRHLIDGGCVLDVPRGSEVTVQGHMDRDLYVVLQGVFTVHRDGTHVASAGRGEFFGETNFFAARQARSATVRAATDGQVLMIRPEFLVELTRDNPDAAHAVFMALGTALSRERTAP